MEVPDGELLKDTEKKAVYFYFIFLVVIILFLVSVIVTLIIDRKKLLIIPSNLFACSLLTAHIFNVFCLIVLMCFFIKYEWIPEQMIEPPKTLQNTPLLFIYDLTLALKILVSTNVILLTVDRFISLYLHLRYTTWLTTNKQYALIVVAWGFPLVLYIISETILPRLVQVAILLSIILICLLLLTIFNLYIFLTVRHHLKDMRSTSIDGREDINLKRKEKRALQITLIIVTSYMIAFIPEVVDKYLSIEQESIGQLVFANGFLFAINSLLDALVYVILNSDIRESYVKMFRKLKCNKQAVQDENYEIKRTEKSAIQSSGDTKRTDTCEHQV